MTLCSGCRPVELSIHIQIPSFKNPVVYRDFLRRLRDSNLIDFSDGPCREIVAVFFVAKKLNRLRMIIDARRSNCHFADPHYVQLATGDSLGRLEFEPGSQLTICAADLKGRFFLSLPVG